MKSWFGELHEYSSSENDESNKLDVQKSNLVALMNSQLSIDLIHTILYSITEHTSGIEKKIAW